ncbi:MAG TPA: DUF2868 domain-containing protein [Candidatus Methylomirabilis sp.]|nr:DUF2868 domain-containing protein [Candidatus Methylomirabilis sp.]
MREEAAQRVLLIQAVEEADRDGQLLTREERAQATAAVRDAGEMSAASIAERRAGRLAELLAVRAPWAEPVLRATRFPGGIVWALVAIAGLAGLGTDSLGPERRINVLSLPILGLILWNLGVYGALLAEAAVHSRRTSAGHGGVPAEREGGPPGRFVAAVAEWRARRRMGARGDAADLVGRAVAAYLGHWRRTAAPLVSARIRLLLHLGAALLAIGVLLGAYARGIALEYRVTWESTFLGPRELRGVLVALLGPASVLLGQPIPSAEALALLRAPSSGDAAPWIHRYALTTALLVLVPRLILAVRAGARARRLSADLPVDVSTPYFRRLAAGAGGAPHIDVVPYGIRLGTREEDALRRALEDFAGAQSQIRVRAAAPYGTSAADVVPAEGEPAGGATAERWVAAVFSLAQTPEEEVHGELLRRLAGWTAESQSGRRRSLVVVDAGPYRVRLAGTGVEEWRLTDRRRAWDRVGAQSGSTVVHVDLAAGDSEAALDSLERSARKASPHR